MAKKAKKVKAKKAKTNVKRISMKKAIEVLEGTNGRFFTVEFTKKNGDKRVMNCQKLAGGTVSKLGYFTVREASLVRQGANGTRRINMQTLTCIKTAGQVYKIRK